MSRSSSRGSDQGARCRGSSVPRPTTIAGPPCRSGLTGLAARGKELKARWWRADNSSRERRKG